MALTAALCPKPSARSSPLGTLSCGGPEAALLPSLPSTPSQGSHPGASVPRDRRTPPSGLTSPGGLRSVQGCERRAAGGQARRVDLQPGLLPGEETEELLASSQQGRQNRVWAAAADTKCQSPSPRFWEVRSLLRNGFHFYFPFCFFY